MQRIILVFVAAMLGMAPAYSQKQRPDHLTPERSILSDGSSMRYEELIVDVLADGYARDVTLRAVVLPSFALEYLVGLREGESGFQVFYLRPTISLWHYAVQRWGNEAMGFRVGGGTTFEIDQSKNDIARRRADETTKPKPPLPADPKDIPLIRCEKPLDAAVARRVSAGWSGVLRETRHPPAGSMPGLDGTAYHFSGYFQVEGFMFRDFLAGQTWSPPRDSKPGRLAELAGTLVQYCDGKAEATELERQADALAERLGK
jgi:hypothetical protein